MIHNDYWIWEKVVDVEFCKFIINNADWSQSEPAQYREPGGESYTGKNHSIRKTDIIFYNRFHPLTSMMTNFIAFANVEAQWNFSINGFQDSQLGRYEKNGHYEWHKDTAKPDEWGNQRKLTAVLLLNDSSEFEGGYLQIDEVEKENLLISAGSIIVFPSFLKHKVSPVTSGIRYTSVCWATGPSFR